MIDARMDAHGGGTARNGDRGSLLVVLGLKDLFAAIDTGRADVMTTMHFAGRRLDRRGRIAEEVVGAM